MKKISIITASYNSEKTILKTFESLLNQTFLNFEYIVIDGNSTDNTLGLIKETEGKFIDKNISFKWISEPDNGIYEAWNKGLQISTGQFISFLGSNDCYVETALEEYYNSIIRNASNNYDLIYSNVRVVNRNGNLIKTINGVWLWVIFRKYMNIAHVGAFHNKNYFNKYGVFDTSYKIAGDYELLLRKKEKLKTLKLDTLTAYMDSEGISNNQIKLAFKETLRAKHETGGINLFNCYYDYYLSFLKFWLKQMVNAISR